MSSFLPGLGIENISLGYKINMKTGAGKEKE